MKRTRSIKRKLMASIISIAMLLNIVVLLVYSLTFTSFFDKKGTQALLDAGNAMKKQVEDQLRLAGQAALRIAFDEKLRNAVVSGNKEEVSRALSALVKESKVDLCVVTDATGTVLARTHINITGDVIAGYATVRAALNGESSVVINSGSLTRLSLNGGAVIFSNRDTVAGTVTAGFRLDSDLYVDKVKSSTGQEIMVFLGDECIASTMADAQGRRMTGMKAPPEIAAEVLAGEQYTGRLTLSGKEYMVCYSPLHSNGKVIGMLFSGLSVQSWRQALADFLFFGSAASLLVLAVMLALVYRVVDNVARPLHELTAAFQCVTDGMTGKDVCLMVEDLLPQSDVTEIDFLQGALRTMLKQLNSTYDLQMKSMEMEIEKERILAASQAKDQVFANISHEIRTPMNAILGISDILLHEGGLSGQQRQYIQDVKISTENLLVIVNDVLDLSKLEAGKMNLSPVDYDFCLFLANIDSLAGHIAEEKDLRFSLAIEGEAPKCLYGDDVRLRQILVNLLGNAAKFTPQGEITLTVRVREDSLQFAVADTGVGIPEGKMQSLFEAFEQVNVGASRHVGGTGLGLSICKHLAELMDGRIQVKSQYGEGSTFTVTVPKIPGDASRIRYWDDEGAVAVARDARILIVDDQRINLNVASGLIRAIYGIECDTALSGRECLSKAEKNEYDLIFMDHMMPGMDGVETTRALRERGGRLGRVPVVALTANAVNGMKEYFLASGMTGFLSKPIRKAELRETMLRWLGREESGTRAGDPSQNFVPSAWAKIPGLDIAEGLDNSGGHKDTYLKSLVLLWKTIPDFTRTARTLFMADALHELVIHIHGMKSALAGVGAKALAERFFAWERAFLANQREACRSDLPDLLECLEAFREALAALPLREKAPPVRKESGDLDQELEALRAALCACDYGAVLACAEGLRSLAAGRDDGKAFMDLFTCIERFDYDGALEWLAEADRSPAA